MQYTNAQLEKAAFYGLCKHYDFLAGFSDDHRAYLKGQAQWATISKAVADYPELSPILQAWSAYWSAYINCKNPTEPQLQNFI